MNPMVALRIAESSSSFIAAASRPFSRQEPLLGRSRRPIMFISVDLPQPEGPMIASRSPCPTSSSTPRRTSVVTGAGDIALADIDQSERGRPRLSSAVSGRHGFMAPG